MTPARPARDDVEPERAGLAIDRLTPEGRAIFVRCIAQIALARALDEIDRETSDERQAG